MAEAIAFLWSDTRSKTCVGGIMTVEDISKDVNQGAKPQPARMRSPAAKDATAESQPADTNGANAAQATAGAPGSNGNGSDLGLLRLPESMAKAGDAYCDGAELAADRVRILLSTCEVLASGARDIQQTCLDTVQRSLQRTASSPRELMQCANWSAVADLQHNLFRDALDEWLDSSSKLLHASSQMAEAAMRPLAESKCDTAA